jgi:hypothetical protein
MNTLQVPMSEVEETPGGGVVEGSQVSVPGPHVPPVLFQPWLYSITHEEN